MNITKRVISTMLCLVMLLTAFPLTGINEIIPAIKASATQDYEVPVYYGDMNENGKIEASDARLILQAAASLQTLTDRQMQLADCNQDGKVTAIDARTTLRVAAKLADLIIFGSVVENIDYLSTYVEFLIEQGKTTYIETSDVGELEFSFADAALYNIDKSSPEPELVVTYYCYDKKASFYPFYACRIYGIENKNVIMKLEYAPYGSRATERFQIWNDPAYKTTTVLHSSIDSLGNYYANVYPTNNPVAGSSKIGPEYQNYISSNNLHDSVMQYRVYLLEYEASDNIRIAVIDDNGKYEIQTFNF